MLRRALDATRSDPRAGLKSLLLPIPPCVSPIPIAVTIKETPSALVASNLDECSAERLTPFEVIRVQA
jgi:hypothetical protein